MMFNLDLLNKQIAADKNDRPVVKTGRLKPIYFDDETFHDVSKHFEEITEICRRMWTVLGFSGLITPWHQVDPLRELSFRKDNLQKWYVSLEKMDVSVEAYCVICCSLSDYTKHERPALLLRQMALMGQVKKLRDYAGSREKVDEVAKFIRRFLDLQISRIGRAYIKKSSVVRYRFENKNKRAFLDTYHRIVDKLNYLDSKGIDYGQWLENKADKCLESFSDTLYINTIVNVNAFEPDIDELFAEVGDPWNPIRKFLGLPKGCEFPDGFIPKGWGISSDDFSELDNIARVMGDGFYYYKDGTQRRGKRHYVSNRYFIIKCDYSNFEEFKEKWYQKSLVSARPTWVEYEKWAMFPGVWNESGESLVHTKDIKWREK